MRLDQNIDLYNEVKDQEYLKEKEKYKRYLKEKEKYVNINHNSGTSIYNNSVVDQTITQIHNPSEDIRISEIDSDPNVIVQQGKNYI